MARGDFQATVGDEVGVVRYNRYYGSITSARFGTVTKINGHGHIFVKVGSEELRFDRRGDSYKNDWGPQLTEPSALRKRLGEEAIRKRRVELARAIESKLKLGWTYSHNYVVDTDALNEIRSMINELEDTVS